MNLDGKMDPLALDHWSIVIQYFSYSKHLHADPSSAHYEWNHVNLEFLNFQSVSEKRKKLSLFLLKFTAKESYELVSS